MIGIVTPYVTTTPPPNCLPCNGSIFNRVDYPVLYEKLAAAYIIDADTFRTPDMRDKFVLGASVNYPMASTGGEASHTMTEDELVPHVHSTVPHSHTEIGAIDTLVNGGVEAPAASASAFPTTTGLADVTINSTGGGAPFSILPPYEAMSYCIVAR